jgi:hypothetical protein
MKHVLKKYPWLFIVLAFLVLSGAWTGLIIIAVKNKPESIPLQPPASHHEP